MSSAPPLVSGEGVALDLARAGVGSRVAAAAIDLALQFAAIFVAVAITAMVGAHSDSAAFGAAVVAEVVLGLAGYPILMEWRNHGRTLGKLAFGLRVVRDDGGPIGFRQALVRGLAGLVLEKPGLMFPFTTALGVLTMLFSAQSKRIGDMMAGTFVLNERAGPRRSVLAREFVVPYPLQGWAAALDLSRVDDQLALGVRQFVVRAPEMTPAAQHQLGEDLRARLEAVTAPPPPPGTPTPWVLITVLAERRRRADLMAARLGAAAPPAAAWGASDRSSGAGRPSGAVEPARPDVASPDPATPQPARRDLPFAPPE